VPRCRRSGARDAAVAFKGCVTVVLETARRDLGRRMRSGVCGQGPGRHLVQLPLLLVFLLRRELLLVLLLVFLTAPVTHAVPL